MSAIVLLDGGMGQELIARSRRPASPLWSAQVMLDEPDIVTEVHRSYVEAGVAVITLNAYSATPERLARDAREDLFEPLQARAIEAAKAAAGKSGVRIGGCLSPLFGSYHPEGAPSYEVCLETYRRIVDCQSAAVDLFILETLSSVKEVKAAVTAARESGKSVICGMSVQDQDGLKLRSGEPLSKGVAAAVQAGTDAVAINCSWPEAVTQGMPILRESGLPCGGWANAFVQADKLSLGGTVDGLTVRNDLSVTTYADHVMGWIERGATIVGGCCEVGPSHIAEIHHRLTKAGHTISGTLQ